MQRPHAMVRAADYVTISLPYPWHVPLQTPLLPWANKIAHEECG